MACEIPSDTFPTNDGNALLNPLNQFTRQISDSNNACRPMESGEGVVEMCDSRIVDELPNYSIPLNDHSYVFNVKPVSYGLNSVQETLSEQRTDITECVKDADKSTDRLDFPIFCNVDEVQELVNCGEVIVSPVADDVVCAGSDVFTLERCNFDQQYSSVATELSEIQPETNAINPFEKVAPPLPPNEESDHEVDPLRLPPAPLGSSENPIQIIQQGNAFRSTQVLTKAQMQQISQVLQQQQLAKAIKNGGQSVLYDPNTNTRIVYRVIYPSELEKHCSSNEDNSADQFDEQEKKSGTRTKKQWSKRSNSSERGKPLLSKAEREEKKKHRPRTRSGRISKPPSYMVKDYKRIHHLDFDEEPYDASDGGYSDYQVSEEDNPKNAGKGMSTLKQRSYNCISCSKAYIGKGGLSRHYRLNPSHVKVADREDATSTQDENSNSSMASSVFSMSGSSTIPGSLVPPARSEVEITTHRNYVSNVDLLALKRKNKLRELLKGFRNEELLEVVLPKLIQTISMWDLFLLKTRKIDSHQSDISAMFNEFKTLLYEMQNVARASLTSSSFINDTGKTLYHLTNKDVAKALSMSTGTYFVKDLKTVHTSDLSSLYKRTNNQIIDLNNMASVSTASDTFATPSKQRKIVETQVVEDCLDVPISHALLQVSQAANHIELQLPSVGLCGNSANNTPHLLATLQETADNQSSIGSLPLYDTAVYAGFRALQSSGNSTSVTPSSLSTGCLSAMDSSEVLQTSHFLSHQGVLGNSLFSSALPNLNSETAVSTLQSYHVKEVQQNTLVSEVEQVPIDDSNGHLLQFANECNVLTTSSCGMQQPKESDLVYGQCNQTNSVFNVPVSSVISLFEKDEHQKLLEQCETQDVCADFASVAQFRTDNLVCNSQNEEELQDARDVINRVVSISNNKASVPHFNSAAESAMNPLPVEDPEQMNDLSVIRHLMLPNGQIIQMWSSNESKSDETFEEQLLQEQQNPGNVVLVQNPDGSYQVPTDQLETLQALLTANPEALVQEKDNVINSHTF